MPHVATHHRAAAPDTSHEAKTLGLEEKSERLRGQGRGWAAAGQYCHKMSQDVTRCHKMSQVSQTGRVNGFLSTGRVGRIAGLRSVSVRFEVEDPYPKTCSELISEFARICYHLFS